MNESLPLRLGKFAIALLIVSGLYWLLRAFGLRSWVNVVFDVLLFVTFVGMLVWSPKRDAKQSSD